MANYGQVYSIVNTIAGQALGESAISAIDATSFVALGNQVLSTSQNVSAFYGALPDVIGRIVSRYQQIRRRTRDIERTPLDFGIALMEIEVDEIARATENRTWEDTSKVDPTGIGNTTNGNLVYKDYTKLSSSIYSKIAGWSIEKIIYDRQLKTAFRNETEMASFINMIFNDMYNGMTLALNDAEMTAEGIAIMQELYANEPTNPNRQKTAVNLLSEYNTTFTQSLTPANCIYDKDFLQWCIYKIKRDITNASQVSNFYTPAQSGASGGKVERELGDFKIHVLSDFAGAAESYLYSDTFHDNFVKLGGYSEIVTWQNRTGATFAGNDDMLTRGQLNLAIEDLVTAGKLTTMDGKDMCVLAHVFADGRMISMVDDLRTKSFYNPIGERTTYSHKADIGYAVRPKEIGITYYIGTKPTFTTAT